MNYGLIRKGGYLIFMRQLVHPPIEEVTVEGVLHALSDPVRMAIFAQIAVSDNAQSCSHFAAMSSRSVPKSTLSQHFRVLREAGLIHSERKGVEMKNTSRCREIEARFPGLLPSIIKAMQVQCSARNPARQKRPAR